MCMVHGSLVVASSPHQLLHNAAAISSSSSSSALNASSSSHSAQQQTAGTSSGAAATSAAAAIAHLGPIAYFVRPDNVLNTMLTASIMKVSSTRKKITSTDYVQMQKWMQHLLSTYGFVALGLPMMYSACTLFW
jgi:hypothetical protein